MVLVFWIFSLQIKIKCEKVNSKEVNALDERKVKSSTQQEDKLKCVCLYEIKVPDGCMDSLASEI
jgi:hypothetical protein